MEPFDPTRPNIARVWDYWLGGKDNFAVDRELAQKMLEVHPPSAQMARENRAPGSYLIISVGSGSSSEGNNFTSAYTAARVYIHSREDVLSFFDGLELVPPGVVSVRGWYGDRPAPDLKPRTATFLGGVARKT